MQLRGELVPKGCDSHRTAAIAVNDAMLAAVLGVYPDCPGASCTGTAWDRHYAAREAARLVVAVDQVLRLLRACDFVVATHLMMPHLF